ARALPIGHRWDRAPGVTLLGSSAHPMHPSGERAGLAVYDGAEPGKALAAHPYGTEAALASYEGGLLPRSGTGAAEASRVPALRLGDNARTAAPTCSPATGMPGEPPVLHPGGYGWRIRCRDSPPSNTGASGGIPGARQGDVPDARLRAAGTAPGVRAGARRFSTSRAPPPRR
ncbi:hypothetical protein ACWCQV_40850, partial [Streptomyces eurythermus]